MKRLMNRKLVFAMVVSLGAGCATLPTGIQMPADDSETGIEAPDVVPTVDQAASQPSPPGLDDCTRYVETSYGDWTCIDALLAIVFADNPRDNDGDGIPNINDDDIDGDGIPNGFDLDADGDGLPNSTDDDIDDDGVANEDDVDIDGDFLRNRWDPDMDGDLLYNPRDPDADGDGKLKFPELSGFDCGPVDLFYDPEACGMGCDPSSGGASSSDGEGAGQARDDDNNSSDSKEDKCKDKGKTKIAGDPDETGQNITLYDLLLRERAEAEAAAEAEEPREHELDRFDDELATLMADDPSTLEDLGDADPNATDAEVLDAAMEAVEAATDMADPEGGGSLVATLPDEAEQEFFERQESIIRLAELPDVDLNDAADVTRRFAAAVRSLGAALNDLVETTIAIDVSYPDTEILSDGAMAVNFIDIADVADIPVVDVPQAIGPTARTTQRIGNQEVAESVWRIVVDQVSAYRNEDDSIAFSLVRVAQATERISGLLDEPTIDAVGESLGNVLAATDAFDLNDPLAVVDRLEALSDADPTFSVADGINADEAILAAEDVQADAP